MEFSNVLKLRKSIRGYKPEQITKEELEKVLWGAYTAPVGRGAFDSLHLAVIQDPEVIENIRLAVADKMESPLKPFYAAPTVILVCGQKSKVAEKVIVYADVACVTAQMHLAATDAGLGSIYLHGFIAPLNAKPEEVAKLGLPEDFIPLAALSVGYPKEPLAERELKWEKIATTYL
ncbi:MAG: nitroreductase family protein [Firmicutes bacterium]|nr:nitroreductase family protein [Bacillota bacterium]